MNKNKFEKKYFDIRLEALIPATLYYRVFAEDEKKALQLIKNKDPDHIKYFLISKKDLLIKIYDAGTTFLKLLKKLT